MIARKSDKEILKYKRLEEIQVIHLQMNNMYFGYIIFGQPEGILGRSDEPFVLGKRYGMNFKEDEYAFLSVENINEIIPVLEQLGLRVNKTFY